MSPAERRRPTLPGAPNPAAMASAGTASTSEDQPRRELWGVAPADVAGDDIRRGRGAAAPLQSETAPPASACPQRQEKRGTSGTGVVGATDERGSDGPQLR